MISPFSISTTLLSSHYSIKSSTVFSLMQIFITYNLTSHHQQFISATRAGYPGAGAMAHPVFPPDTAPAENHCTLKLLQELHSEAL